MRCIEIQSRRALLTQQHPINYNMRCIEIEMDEFTGSWKGIDKLQHEMY